MPNLNVGAPLILFVDDEETAVKYFQRAIGALAPVVTAGSVADGKRMLDKHAKTLAVLVSDQRMPGGYGNELLHYARDHYPYMVRILTTAYSELEQTIDAVNQGQIHRYIQKPWDITLLRMELKQALELASLRKEHGSLLQEKLEVRQKQLIANRIGALHSLCINLTGSRRGAPLATYLATVHQVGASAPVPNWAQMDYFDVVTAEAVRNGEFSHGVRIKLAETQARYSGHAPEAALDVLSALLPDKLQPSMTGDPILIDEGNLTEFLEAPIETVVSQQHVNWLVFLLWLDGLGWSLEITRTEQGLQCRPVKSAQPILDIRLVDWIEQF